MNIPITQSRMWEKLQHDLKERSFFISNSDYHFLAILKFTPTGNYLYCPYGPCYESAAGFRKALNNLYELAKTNKAIFVRIEPQDSEFQSYAPKNTKKVKDLNPKETWLLDLQGTEDELKSKFPSRLLRYYKASSRKGIAIETSHNPEDIKFLLKLQKTLARKKGINTFSEQYLKTELKQPFSTLYLVKYQKLDTSIQEIVAAGLVFDDKTTRYNLQGAQSEQGRSLHATGILTIQLILDAKQKNLQHFDFWGIAPVGAPPDHPWAGFTSFKKSFKGYKKEYAGTYDIVLKPAKYKLYESTRKLNRLLRKK